MRFSRVFAFVAAAFSVTSVTAAPSAGPGFGSELQPRQLVDLNACATVGPITSAALLPFLFPRITILPSICLCTQAGVLTPESIARLRAQLVIGQQNGLLTQVLQLLSVTVDGLLQLLLPDILGPVNESGQCDVGIPANGYPVCASANAPAGQCAFACDDGYKVCGTGCILNSVPCPSTVQRRSTQAVNVCPTGWTSCPVASGNGVVYECIATDKDLESCGGCSGLRNDGVDCSSLPGVNDVACVVGKCRAKSCLRGYELVDGTCQKNESFKAARSVLA